MFSDSARIAAVFLSTEAAEAARDNLRAVGFTRSQIRIIRADGGGVGFNNTNKRSEGKDSQSFSKSTTKAESGSATFLERLVSLFGYNNEGETDPRYTDQGSDSEAIASSSNQDQLKRDEELSFSDRDAELLMMRYDAGHPMVLVEPEGRDQEALAVLKKSGALDLEIDAADASQADDSSQVGYSKQASRPGSSSHHAGAERVPTSYGSTADIHPSL